MVSLNRHDHGDGPVCPGCQFKAVLADHLAWAAQDSEESWSDLAGEMIVLMGTAIGMLTALRLGRVDGGGCPANTASSAAAAISRLGGVIDETWHTLMDDDDADDDPGAAL